MEQEGCYTVLLRTYVKLKYNTFLLDNIQYYCRKDRVTSPRPDWKVESVFYREIKKIKRLINSEEETY